MLCNTSRVTQVRRVAPPKDRRGVNQVAKILCIDTDERYGKYVCSQLKEAGHVCLLDKRGERALQLIEQNSIDLVITEVMLPDVCGFEICRRVRAHPQLFTLPVILMSTMASEDEVHHGLTQGADDYLAKPFQGNMLVSRVNEQLRSAAAGLQPDAITGLAGAKMIKAVIQQAITQKTAFATAYIELENIAEFGKVAGEANRDKALRHISRIIKRHGEVLNSSLFHAAHIGTGHFVCVLAPDPAAQYCEQVAKNWENHLPEFYDLVGMKMPKKSRSSTGIGGTPLLNILICLTDSRISGARSVTEYFELLAQLRHKASQEGATGLYADNRQSSKKKKATARS